MNIPKELKYTQDHEWVRIEGNHAVVGITDYAQRELGDIVFIEMDAEGESLAQGEVLGTIEAVKTVSDVFMPLTGVVEEVNGALESNPEWVNKDPYGDGWMVKIHLSNLPEVEALLTPEAYEKLVNA